MQEAFLDTFWKHTYPPYFDPAEHESACYQVEILTGSEIFKMAANIPKKRCFQFFMFAISQNYLFKTSLIVFLILRNLKINVAQTKFKYGVRYSRWRLLMCNKLIISFVIDSLAVKTFLMGRFLCIRSWGTSH